MSDHLLALLGLAGTIIFGVISVILGWRTLQKRRVYWGCLSEVLSTSGYDGELSIAFGERKFSRVVITRLVLWNSGNGSIVDADIAKTDPLHIKLKKGGEILSASVIGQTSEGVGAKVSVSERNASSIQISFEILNPGEGFALKLFHNGIFGEENVAGTLKDVRDVIEVPIDLGSRRFLISRRIAVGAAITVIGFGSIITALITLLAVGTAQYAATIHTIWLLAGLVLVIVAMIIIAGSEGTESQLPPVLVKVLRQSFGDAK